MIILDEVRHSEWKFWEQYWISQFTTWGYALKNMTPGGDGNTIPIRSKEFKEAVSKKMKGRGPAYLVTESIREKKRVKQQEQAT